MNSKLQQPIIPKKRIDSIDALRGFALLGILLCHCMEHFDLTYVPQLESPFWQKVDNIVADSIYFIFAGKSYAIFSLLFGLSFFMQMDSQARQGKDFRGRFVWRLFILLILGYINGLVYMGEFFVVYAILGLFLIPLYKVGTKWLLALCVLLFLQLPDLITFISLLNNNVPNEPSASVVLMGQLYEKSAHIFINGSLGDVLKFNLWEGQATKLLWIWNNSRYLQLIGLFIIGMLIGRYGIHKSEEKMVAYSRKFLPYSVVWFAFFYLIVMLLPHFGVKEFALYRGTMLFKMYANLGMMMMYVCLFTLLFYKTKAGNGLSRLAPVGRMSVTNYMAQSVFGVLLFYGFGANLAVQLSLLQCLLVGIAIYTVQVLYSNWWMKRYYYGPVEWLWRILTWFKHIPLKR